MQKKEEKKTRMANSTHFIYYLVNTKEQESIYLEGTFTPL